MRTTITLEPDVQALIRTATKERGISFKEALNSAVRAGLSQVSGAGTCVCSGRDESRAGSAEARATFDHLRRSHLWSLRSWIYLLRTPRGDYSRCSTVSDTARKH